jgi:hypothetical protein
LLKELAVESYRFACAGCGHVWSTDYDVQHVEDGHGVTWEYHSLDGIPVPSPTGPGSLTCPRCGAPWIDHELLAVRTVPLVETPAELPDRPRRPVDVERRTRHRQAALRDGDQPTTDETVRGLSGAEP